LQQSVLEVFGVVVWKVAHVACTVFRVCCRSLVQ
jgi:hypothetical protein